MIRDQRGQITVFLSLLFLVLLGATLGILEGMRCYETSSLAEEAVLDAGEEILAYYDRALFDRYHLFFLDPRERRYLSSDGEAWLNQSASNQGFYGFSCRKLTVTEEKTAVDEKGLFLKHEIREWMKYQETVTLGDSLKQLIRAATGMDGQAQIEAGKFRQMEEKEEILRETERESAEKVEEEKEGEGDSGGQNLPARNRWREFRKTLQQMLQSGVLFYAVDDPGTLSSAMISMEGLPSKEQGIAVPSLREWGEGLSFVQLSEWKELLETAEASLPKISNLTEKACLLEYLTECFSYYEPEIHPREKETVLQYELEYLIGGKASDRENLRLVADRILMMRFVENYLYACRDAEIQAKATAMSAGLTGILGMPQGQKAVSMLLTAALSYGESLLELHALLSGQSIAIHKNASTWNLMFENGGTLLASRGKVKQGTSSVNYETFLRLLLLMDSSRDTFFYRMMDLMQVNVALDETGFQMKECLFSFRWEVTMQMERRFVFLPGLQIQQSRTIPFPFEKQVSY